MDPLVTLTATSLSKDLSRSELREIIFNDRAQIHNNLAQMASILEKNIKLEEECKKLKEDNSILLKVIKNNEEKIDFLKHENESLRSRISELEQQVKKLNEEKLRTEAIMKLYECDMIANKAFKKAYRKHFNLEFLAPVPDLGDFVGESISKEEYPGSYSFWENFKINHPGSDNSQFQEIYYSLNANRAPFAHPKVARLSKDEFDVLAKVAFDDYETRKNIYDSYRDWLYSFPA